MINEQERKNIIQGFENIQQIIHNILFMLDKYRSQQSIIISIVKTRFPHDDFKTTIENFIMQENVLQFIKEAFSFIPNLEETINNQYKTFLTSQITQFHPESMHLLQNEIRTQICHFIDNQKENHLNIAPQDSNIIAWIHELPNQYTQYINSISSLYSNLRIFEQIKHIEGSIVMIGANGSGKSTFARQFNGKISGNLVILSAQHLLHYTKSRTISTQGNELEKVRNFQRNTKLSNSSDFQQLITTDMNELINALISQHTDCSFKYYESDKKEISFLSKTAELWNKIVEHRALEVSRTGLTISGDGINSYDFNQLSDGEKAIFYYIAHILLASENSYIIVDEPENHLHLTICNKLWDELEKKRSDCKFIYLTHNLNFATSRSNSTVLWNKKFVPPYSWDFEILPQNDIIPEVLIMELVGSRKNICFCESQDRSKLDYKLYNILFPEYTVIPAAGHRNVIDYVNAYNSIPSFITQAIGIIDGDHHLPAQTKKWQEQKIYTIPINEVENILCDNKLLQRAIETFCSSANALEEFHNTFFLLLDSEKEHLATYYVNEYLNNLFKENFLHEKQNIDSLISECQELLSQAQIQELYNSTLTKITDFITNKNYDDALRFVNLKGRLTKDLAKRFIVDKYENRILDLIKKDSSLQQHIRNTYFGNFICT